jgi:hypothetical protein
MAMAVARAELRGAEKVLAKGTEAEREIELQKLRGAVQDAVDQFKADDDEPCTCDWCGLEVDEESDLRDVSKLERADGLEYEPDLICLGCWDDEAEKQEARCGAYEHSMDVQEGRTA